MIMEINFEITPVQWFYDNFEEDEQPSGVLIQVSNGDTQYLTMQEYKKLLNKKTSNG